MFGNFSKLFHKQTDYNFPIGTPPSNPQSWPKTWREIEYKSYPMMSKIKLSENVLQVGKLENALEKRHSLREYNPNSKLSFDELSTLLYLSSGVKKNTREEKTDSIRRFYPSGGARYPLEVYLGIQSVEGIEKGLYHYNVKDNLLENIGGKEWLNDLLDGLLYPWSKEAAVVFIITAVWDRNFIKYKDRGYRMVLIEAGHLMQNLNLVAANLNIGCCDLMGFNNEYTDEVLDIRQRGEELSVYMAVLGR